MQSLEGTNLQVCQVFMVSLELKMMCSIIKAYLTFITRKVIVNRNLTELPKQSHNSSIDSQTRTSSHDKNSLRKYPSTLPIIYTVTLFPRVPPRGSEAIFVV